MKLVPEWRKAAGPGVALAQAKAPSGAATAPAAQQVIAPAVRGTAGGPPAMQYILRPNVRDRWLASQLSYFTPQIVENTIRGAMAGNLLAQWLMFDLMEQTWPRLNSNLNTLKDAVVDLDWPLQAAAPIGDKPSAEAQRRKKVVESIIEEMDPEPDNNECDFEDTQRDIMDAVGKGIAVSEILWAAPGDAENTTGLWVPRATRWAHPRYYGYAPQPGTDDRLMLNLMEVRLANAASGLAPESGGQYARFPRDKFLISVMKQKSGHPISGAMLRILGAFWAAQNFTWEWFLNLAQIFGVPIRWATYATGTANAGTIQAIEEMLATLGSAGYGAFPEGTKLEIKESAGNAKDNPAKAFIDAADTVADIIILGQTLTTTQGERGSQSLGEIHKTVRDEKIHAVAKRVAKVLNNQFVRSICRLNFGDTVECPWFQPSTKESKDVAGTATRYKTLLSIDGVRISQQQFYEDNDLVVPDADDPVFIGSASGPMGPDGGLGAEDGGPKAAMANAADAATERLVNNTLEGLTGVQGRWLGGVKPFFRELVAKAKDDSLSDADFVRTLERAAKQMPELFAKMDHAVLAKALENAMGSAVVNGAVRGSLRRSGRGQQ
jgi:phage gp29-like protein